MNSDPLIKSSALVPMNSCSHTCQKTDGKYEHNPRVAVSYLHII